MHLETIYILIVEDDEGDAIILSELLTSSELNDYQIAHVHTLKEASAYIHQERVDIILINLNLPDSFGIHTFDKLFREFPSIPFIVMTAMEDDLIGINAVQKGAQDFLIKGNFDGQGLNRCVHYAIERKQAEERIRKSEEKYRDLFMRSKDAIYMSTKEGDFLDINPAGLALFGYSREDLDRLKVIDLYADLSDRYILLKEMNDNGEVSDYEIKLQKKDGELVDCLLNALSIRDDQNKIVAYQGIIRDITEKKKAEEALKTSLMQLDIANKDLQDLNVNLEEKVEARTSELQEQKNRVELQNKEITESINYAKRIQASILPERDKISRYFPNFFINYRPKDIVSGDFYWFQGFQKRAVLAIVDCTGHGVPGAFMSIIGYTQLNSIVIENGIMDPGAILKLLDKKVRIALNQKKGGSYSNDGMEMGIISVNFETNKLEFAGAMRPLYYTKNNELHIIRGDKFSVGGTSRRAKDFQTHSISIAPNDCYYLFSDGYADQFGGQEGKKFKSRNVGKMLNAIQPLSMPEQGKIIDQTFDNWQGTEAQVDDVLIAGIKF